MLVSIVIPCYNSEHTIGKVVELAIEEFSKMKDYECEFVLVNDFSRDGTWKSIQELTARHSNVKGMMAHRRMIPTERSSVWEKIMPM